MDSCQYQEIIHDTGHKKSQKETIESKLRQIIVIGGINSVSFSYSFTTGQISSMVRSLNMNEEGINLERNEISIIASSIFLLCIFGLGLAAVVSDKIGRRWTFIFFSTLLSLNWIVLYNAYNMLTFMISRVLAGVAGGALYGLNLCSISEYTSPNTRAVFLNIIAAFMPAIAITIAHILGIVMHWRYVALISIIPSMIGVILPYFWVESPHWLASKGCFEECEVAFRKLHGNGSEAELELLIKVEKAKMIKAKETNSLQIMKKLSLAAKSRYFWDLIMLSVFIYSFLTACGKSTFNSLSIVIIEELTGSSDILFFTLLIDGIIIVGAITSGILITKLSMRNLLFTSGLIAIFILLSLSACIYFNNGTVLFQWINVVLFAVYFFIIEIGPNPILESLLGEIYPLEVKVYCFFISGTIFMCALSLNVMILPYMVSTMGYYGVFLLNAVIMSISLGYIWLRLPETKGRTLQEIEIYFKTKTFQNVDQATSNEQIKALI